MTLDDIIRNANGGKLASDTDNSNDTQPQEQSNPGLFDKISTFLSDAGQAYGNADNPGAEVYYQTPYADNLTNEVHDQNMADGQNIYTVLAPNYTPRPLDDSVYTDIPGTPVDLGTLEDESVRNARMQDSADYMAANWPRLYGAGAGAVENGANVVGGIQNALGLGDSTLQNAEQFEKGMQDYRKQWDATYGDSYFLNPNNFANDAGAVIGSTAPILALSAMTPGALVAGGSRALTGALSRAGLGRLAMSKAGQALIADTVRTLPSSSLADSLSEYGGVVHDLMQNGMSEDEARAQAVPIFYKNMALDTAVLPLELGIAKGGKGLITGLLKRNAGENMGKGLAKGTARTGILSGLSGITEGYQEGAQNALEDQTKGERDGGWYNPVTWTPEDWRSARAGFVGGALMGIPGNVATAYRPDTKQADLSPEAQTQVQDIKNTLMNDATYGNMDSDTYNSYLELANSGNPALIKLANDSLASWKEKQGISTDSTASTDMTAGEEQAGPVNAEMEAEKDRIRQYLNDNTIEQMGGQKNYDWLYNTLNSTDPDEVHKAYQTAVESTAETQEQEAAQAEQQDEEQPTGNVSINSDNPFIGYVVKAANDQGIDPKIALAIAARETGGDDVNAINMAPNGGLMQITEDSAGWYGVNDLYPDWRSDPEQNAEAGMYILKKKIEEAGGDTWAGVRGYNGAGEAADQYLNQIQQNYDNLGDIGGSSWSGGVSGYDLPTQSDEITAQVETLKPEWKQALPAIGGILNDMGLADGSAISSAGRTSKHNAEVNGAKHSYHINDDERGGGDAVDIVLPKGTTEEQAQAVLDRFKSTGAFKEVLFHDVGSGYHLHLGGYTGGLNGRTGNVDSDMADIRRQQDAEDRAFDEQEREINDDSRAAMNRIMNDNSVENAFDETQRDTEAAKKQQEETLKALTNDTQEEQPAQTPEIAQNQPQNGTDTTVDATAPIGQQTAITGANTATKTVQQNQPVQTAQAQPIQTPAGTQDPRINKAIHDPAMLNLVTRSMNGDSVAKESVGNLNQNIVDAVQQHIIATALNAHQQRIAKAPAGKTETILSDDVKTEYPAQYKIVSVDDITPSNNTDGSVNTFYPQQYQPRDRTRAGMRKQVEDMANNLNPSALGASNNANMGAPVINSQGVVLNGNGRTMALKSVYKGKPKQIKAYKYFLKQNANSLGIDPATIDSVKNPVLVRQVADDAPVQDIINSKAGGSQMSAGETAKKDADRIKQSTLQLASDSGDLTQESNRKFVNAVLKDVASPEELNTLYTKTGKIGQAGITRAKNALFAKAYGDDYLLTKMSESTDNNIRNVMNAMLTVAPKVAMLNDGMGKGLFYSYPLSDVISGSAKTLIGLREQNKPVKFYLKETSLITESENQNSINDVLQFIDNNKRSGKTITAFFNEICNEIELQGHPDQGALIASENPTMEEVINIAERKVENNGVQSLFDAGRSEGNQKDTASGRMADGVLPGTSAGTETNAGTNGSERKEESTGKTESRPEVAKGEANEENTESNHVNAEPQQTESKNTESTHAEEGSQGDVQEEISKFHNVLDDEKSTPKQVIDAYKSVVDKAIANANGSRKNAKIGDKIVTDEYQYLTNSKHWDAFMNKDGGRNWHEVATINADAHKTLRTIIKTAGKETAPKAEQPKETKPTEQPKEKAAGGFTDDEIKTLTDRGFNRWTKKLSNGKVMDRLYIKPEYLGLELTRYKSGNISSAKFNGETISNSEARRIEGTKCYVDVATKEVVCDREDLKQAAQEVIDDALSKEKSQVLAQAKTKKAAPKDDFKLANGYRTESGSPLKEADKAEKGKKYSVREANGQLTRSKEDLKAEIKEAFPNAKEIKDEGDRMTFTMPNGSHIIVDMKNEIVLTDKDLAQAKKDHHIDDNGNVVVEGYAEAHGKDAYMALAQGSREGTGFHEAYHIAEDAVLTDREKAAIKKAIPDAEERADKYAEWVEARKHGRGTAWGKLFQKIKDFAMKMKAIFTGAENVHNVFRKIESGEVWERNANGQNSGRRYSVTKPKDAAEEAREKAEQDAENTAVTLNDILTEARKIVPIYTKSKVGEKSPAKYHYDARQRAGFVPGSFDVGDIGSAIALHIDSIGEIKGANIELTKDIIEDRQMEQRNAKKYKSKVPPDISPSQARQEGVRNFGRLYFLDNERAKETYPQYYDLFEKALDGMPKEKAGVEKVLALQDQRVRQNPLLSAAAGISNGKPDSQLTWKERMKKRLLHLYAQMVDETDPIGQLTKALELETGAKIADEKDPHKRALMCNSVASARAFMLLDGDNRVANLKALNKVYKGAIKNKVVFADVIDKLGKVTKAELKKAEVKDAETLLSMYLIAARTEEIIENNKDYIRPDGYEHETCMRILVNAPQAIKDAATMFWKYNENLVNIIEQQGLITHAAAEGMRKYKKYCPMYRDFNEGDSVDTHIATINTGRGFINQTSGIKSLSGGSSRPVINPVDSMINMTTVLIGKCERNNVAKIMVQCAEDHGGLGNVIVRDPTLTGADRQRCAFTVIKAGKKVVYRTTPELYESITQMDTNSAAFMSNLFGKFTDALRFGSTNTPSFMMKNFIRDTVTAGINSKYGFTPLVDSFRGMWKLTHDKQFKADFYAQGVPMDTYIRNDIRGAQDFKKKLRKDLKKYPFGIRQAMWFMSATARKYNNVGELIEQGTRAGEFLKARKKGATEEEAGYAAREVSINFSRHGSVGKKINRYIPFFNASIQGIDKFIRTFKENPKRAIWATIKYIILPSLACWAFNHDDDWYKDLDPTTKYLNWCIHIPGTDTHFLIPKPQEVGVMFGSGIEAVLNQFLADDPKAMKQWAWELAGVMTPGLAVTMIRGFFEWQRNYSLWTNHNLVPKRLEKLPSEQQYTNSTSELAKLLGDTWIAKNISVGDRHGISPIAIDNFFSAWFGSMGRTLAKTLDKPIESLRGKDRPTEPAKYWYESPVIGSFVRNDDSQRSAYVDRLYDLSDQMETDYKRSDSYAVQKGKKGAKVPTELAQVRTAMKTVSKLNKEIRDIQDNPKMSAEEKRTQIDTRKVKMRGIAKKAVLKLGD